LKATQWLDLRWVNRVGIDTCKRRRFFLGAPERGACLPFELSPRGGRGGVPAGGDLLDGFCFQGAVPRAGQRGGRGDGGRIAGRRPNKKRANKNGIKSSIGFLQKSARHPTARGVLFARKTDSKLPPGPGGGNVRRRGTRLVLESQSFQGPSFGVSGPPIKDKPKKEKPGLLGGQEVGGAAAWRPQSGEGKNPYIISSSTWTLNSRSNNHRNLGHVRRAVFFFMGRGRADDITLRL